tara:strand:+ start:4326 stop:4685 length:360 start_codon:yes stop_codon:yes gene_type:complete
VAFEDAQDYGVDAPKALMLLANNEDLYKRLLTIFKEDYANFFSDISQVIADGDKAKAKQMLHTLKGVAGNLGATELFDEAKNLDEHMKDELDLEWLSANISALEAPLNKVLAFIDKHAS